MATVAAIDVGTNSVLLLLSRLDSDGTIQIVQDLAVVTRLGKNVAQNKMLDPIAIARTLSTLSDFVEIAKIANATIVAVGTSALREVQNANAFLRPAEEILKTSVEVISGVREAELAYVGAIQGVDLKQSGCSAIRVNADHALRANYGSSQQSYTVIDVGGGSTEIAHGQGSNLISTQSLDLGAVRLSEKYDLNYPLSEISKTNIKNVINDILEQDEPKIIPPIIGIGGTATTLAAIIESVDPYDPDRIHNLQISKEQIDETCTLLARLSLSELREVKGLEKGRADIIVPGALILGTILTYAQATLLTISVGGIRFGLTLEAYQKNTID